jgi:PAS domain S-box-containing protein
MLKPSDLGIGQLFPVVGDSVIVGEVSTGRIVLWNPAAERMFGYPAEEAVGMPIEELVPPSFRDQHRTGFTRFATTGQTTLVGTGRAAEVPARRRDGSEFWVDLTLSPLDGAAVPGRFVLAIVRDVTERREARAQFAATAAQLQAANRSLREFLVTAAHDLRTPLTVIVSAAGLLASLERVSPEVADLGEMIQRQGEALHRIIGDFAELGHIELGEVAVNPVRVDVADVATEAAEAAGFDPGEAAAGIPDGIGVWADRSHVRRIITNYLTNALKYGGASIAVIARRAGRCVDIGVIDNGPGVPGDFVDQLFEKFSRHPSGRHQTGRGLGLAIAAGLARANGGNVWYEPNSPGGSQFWVALPAQPGSGPAS